MHDLFYFTLFHNLCLCFCVFKSFIGLPLACPSHLSFYSCCSSSSLPPSSFTLSACPLPPSDCQAGEFAWRQVKVTLNSSTILQWLEQPIIAICLGESYELHDLHFRDNTENCTTTTSSKTERQERPSGLGSVDWKWPTCELPRKSLTCPKWMFHKKW